MNRVPSSLVQIATPTGLLVVTREHAIGSVELAARRLGVDVASRIDDARRVVASAAHRKDVAGAVDLDRGACIAEPADDEIAALPVQIGKGEPSHTALRGRADLRQVHERLPETGAVDAHGARPDGRPRSRFR
jgi:hypothetical protein